MNLYSIARLIVLGVLFGPAVTPAFACSCIHHPEIKTPWELAKNSFEQSDVIFVGVPERVELKWKLLEAKNGALVSPGFNQLESVDAPRMVVKFRVKEAYKGSFGSTVEVNTGLGGGDCGAQFDSGLEYLVYADQTPAGLGVSSCSPGGWTGVDSSLTELRYLKKDPPNAGDLAPHPATDGSESDKSEREQSARAYENRLDAVTGQICGRVSGDVKAKLERIVFLSALGSSPVAEGEASVNEDGSFCSARLGPGKYYLYFWSADDEEQESPNVGSYYPGVTEPSDANTVEVVIAETSRIHFSVPPQEIYAVRGSVSVGDHSSMLKGSVTVMMIDADGTRLQWYEREVSFEHAGPQTKAAFSFDKVFPGHYVAFVVASDDQWLSTKRDVTVGPQTSFVTLELVKTQNSVPLEELDQN
jgi:hypothetical protein